MVNPSKNEDDILFEFNENTKNICKKNDIKQSDCENEFKRVKDKAIIDGKDGDFFGKRVSPNSSIEIIGKEKRKSLILFAILGMLLITMIPIGYISYYYGSNKYKSNLIDIQMDFNNTTLYNYAYTQINQRSMGIDNSTWELGKIGTQYYYQNFSFTESVYITDFTMFIKNQSANSINFTISLFYQRPSNQFDPEYIVKKTIKINETSPKAYSNFTINFDSEIFLWANHGYWFMMTFLNLNTSAYFGSIPDTSVDDVETYHLVGTTWVNQLYTISYSMKTYQKDKLYFENASTLISTEINLYNNNTNLVDYKLIYENDNLIHSYNFSIHPKLENIYRITLGFKIKDNITSYVYNFKFEIKNNEKSYYFSPNNKYSFSNFAFYKISTTEIGVKELDLNNIHIIIPY